MGKEAGLKVSARRLFGVRHKAISSYPADVRDFYKMVFLCDRTDNAIPEPGLETIEARFFGIDDLPPLSRGRTIEADIHAAFAYATDTTKPACLEKGWNDSTMTDQIAWFRITLEEMKPAIWRRVELPETNSLKTLHLAIQACMLCENYHLFRFEMRVA